MKYLTELNNICGKIINYNSIDKDKIYVRNYKNGISLQHAFLYNILYSKSGL